MVELMLFAYALKDPKFICYCSFLTVAVFFASTPKIPQVLLALFSSSCYAYLSLHCFIEYFESKFFKMSVGESSA